MQCVNRDGEVRTVIALASAAVAAFKENARPEEMFSQTFVTAAAAAKAKRSLGLSPCVVKYLCIF